MNRTLATARRVLHQLSHDRRSVAIIVVLPALLLVMFRYVYDGDPQVFQRIGPQMLGIFPFIVMFLVTSVTMVRERTSGTLERSDDHAAAPRRADRRLRAGLRRRRHSCSRSISAVVAIWWLDLGVQSPWTVVLFAVVDSLLGTALGLFFSAFARTEFQAVQFMPVVVIPQLLLCGLLVPRDRMAPALEWLSTVVPLTWATDAFTQSLTTSGLNGAMWRDLAILIGFVVAAVAGASLTLRRRTA